MPQLAEEDAMGIIEAFAEVDKRQRDDEAVIRTLTIPTTIQNLCGPL